MGVVEVKTIKRVNRENEVSASPCLVTLQVFTLSEAESGGRMIKMKTERLYINTFLSQCHRI